MKNNLLQEERNWRNISYIILLMVLTVVAVVWFLPRDKTVQFRYDIGHPWSYGSFIAKFDFPVYKTDEVIKREQDSVLNHFQPYYKYDASVERENLDRFAKDMEGNDFGLTPRLQAVIVDRLHRLYQAGIMGTPEYNSVAKDSTAMVRMVVGKQAQSVQVNCIYSTLSAYEKLFNDDVLSQQRQVLQRCNLNNYLEPNLVFDKQRNEAEKNDLLSGISSASGMVMSGQKVIDRGEIVDDYTYRVLSSFEREVNRRSSSSTELTSTIIGQLIYVSILVLLFTLYLYLFRSDYFEKQRSVTMLYVMIAIFPIMVSFIMAHSFFNVYILPFAMVPIFVRVFMDSRTAFVAHCAMVLICTAAVKYQYEFVIVQLVSGMVAIYSLRELSNRAQVFKTALWVVASSALIFFALQMMQDNDISKLDYGMYKYFAISGVILLLSYPMMYIIEKTFGFVSNVTLIELSNTNKGLLRDLSEVAPGTFQHSITVGNLAAEIANRIGANSLLVRTGALYHDIGKMVNPVFFTENQAGVNPHDHMDYKVSAQIVISHVPEGVKMAEKANLPGFIKDFILTHHGRGVTRYFYVNYQNEHPDEEVDMEPFTYPGPNPFTREQAILMMADTVEAASRSLPEYTEESIGNLVNKLIDMQLESGFFTECPITFLDVAQAKVVLIERLKSIYHTRVSYPELHKEEKQNPENGKME